MDTENIVVDFKEKSPLSKKLLPLILLVSVILADQITKFLVVKYIPITYPPAVAFSWFDGFVRIIHVCNPGIAFSIGQGWSLAARATLFRVLPLIVIGLVLFVYFRNDDFTGFQRWAICGIAGGGIGNLIDRFFRSEGVVDFIDVKWFGLTDCPVSILQMDRWPTFNVADAAVVVCGFMLIISFVFTLKNNKDKKEEK